MSIQPNRVIHRIVAQVDRSDWPSLPSQVVSSKDGQELLRLYRLPRHARYVTPMHFWVHCLRDELSATGHREELVGAAGHALGRKQPFDEWLEELSGLRLESGGTAAEALEVEQLGCDDDSLEAYRMLESACRRSSVVATERLLMAHFWGHGGIPSWRCKASS